MKTVSPRTHLPKHTRFIALALIFPAGFVQAATYAPWLRQIGMNDAIMSAANWGTGQVLGVVDTGINPTHPVFAKSQVSQALSACAAVSFRCSNGVRDDNNHGTAVAAIAAGNKPFAGNVRSGNYTITAGSVISVAPNANIVAKKVLNANGSGYSMDVANGVRKAADAGAGVINVSITYGNTADMVSAINYAAAKGAFIVWAGGNSNTTLLRGVSTGGLTPQAISRLVFVGSVNASNSKSSFSNTPGSGKLINTSNQATAYSLRWLMAPGEGILAPYTTAGDSAWYAWSGTSMAAPIVSGSVILLQSAWPILKTRGTSIDLLLATATDLGAKGTDSTYGKGLVNLDRAFQPYGTLTVARANGSALPLSSLTGKMISSGALGSLAAVQSRLANYTALDTYLRNFTVNLSGLIKSPSGKASLNALPTNVNKGPRSIKLSDGRELAYWQGQDSRTTDHRGEFGFNEELAKERQQGFAMFSDPVRGTSVAMGYGYPVQYAFTRALTGDEALAQLSHDTALPSLMSLNQGGTLVAAGLPLSNTLRFAASWSNTASTETGSNGNWSPAWATPEAHGMQLGVNYQLNRMFSTGVKIGALTERHGLLGSTYDADSAVSLGRNNNSMSYAATLGVRLNADQHLLFESGFARSSATQADGVFAGTSRVRSTFWSASYQQTRLLQAHDRLTLSLRQPLRVSQGEIGVMNTLIADDGEAVLVRESVSLRPDGRELEQRITYALPTGKRSDMTLQASYRKDADNIRGNDTAAIGMNWNTRF